ncbi:MAG: histidinol dehydrogenase [Gammaproteobacteria bacterium]
MPAKTQPSVELPTYFWSDLDALKQREILQRPPVSLADPMAVANVIEQVRADGDAAIYALTARYDGVKLLNSRVPKEVIQAALDNLSPDLLEALKAAYDNIERFHRAQETQSPPVETASGMTCEIMVRPIDAVGLYVPGGTAPLPSTVLMLGVPSQLAKCTTRVLCTPPQKDGQVDQLVLAAAALCGIDQVFSVGGAQAIAAMAYGTETIPKVNKIFGPGNPWVTRAKQIVAQDADGAGCDMPAGPSEVLVIADDTANPSFVAADLLAQAEHGIDSQVILVTTSGALADGVKRQLLSQIETLSRRHIAAAALASSRIIIARNVDEAFAISNAYAPEHLIINTTHSRSDVEKVTNAGSVFVGAWTPESLGDYCSGTNHVLPTNGYASHVSGVGLGDFQKRITVQEASEQGLESIGWIAQRIAGSEGLDAHAQAVTIRMAQKNSAKL